VSSPGYYGDGGGRWLQISLCGERKPVRSAHATRPDGVTKKGSLIYSCGDTAVRDDGRSLAVSRRVDLEGLRAALDTGPVRTGVTTILPRGSTFDPVFAGSFSFNGNGDMTGTHWISESGFMETPILITNTGSVGVVRDAALAWMEKHGYYAPFAKDYWYAYPVVTETYDGILNDINGHHVKPEHAWQALDSAKGGPVPEGAVGGGTGMIAHQFKGGTGTSSRKVDGPLGNFTVGVLVQANYGGREEMRIGGLPISKALKDIPRPVLSDIPSTTRPLLVRAAPTTLDREMGSIVVIVATDAPLNALQCQRLARRVTVGLSRVGGKGGTALATFSSRFPQVILAHTRTM
jgi:D-aminopeptidase